MNFYPQVLKMRTRSEGNYKVEETRTYQFSSPAAPHTSSAPTPGPPSSAMAVKNGSSNGGGGAIDNGCTEYLLSSPTHSETTHMVTATASRVPLVTPTARRAVTSATMGGRVGSVGATATRITQPPLPSNKATVTPAPSSFYERHVRKHINVTSKAVREWYV